MTDIEQSQTITSSKESPMNSPRSKTMSVRDLASHRARESVSSNQLARDSMKKDKKDKSSFLAQIGKENGSQETEDRPMFGGHTRSTISIRERRSNFDFFNEVNYYWRPNLG